MKREEYEKILKALEDECSAELQCAKECEYIGSKTLNPIKSVNCALDANRFMQHVLGIDLVIGKFKEVAVIDPD